MKRLLAGVLVCAGCGPSTEVGLDADDDYQKACVVDDDCVAVFFGNVCESGCQNGAIHVDAHDAYTAQFASDEERCAGIAEAPTDYTTAVACLSERCLLRGGEQ
jgi:hypothetical protein